LCAGRWAAHSPGTMCENTASTGKAKLIVKGVLHPQDAEQAVSLGVDGLIVSNHGGRQVEALPAPIDALPAIVRQVGTARRCDDGFRRAQWRRRGPRLCARRRRGVRWQGFFVGPWGRSAQKGPDTSSIC